jgi:hypothetical protein
MKVIRAHIKDSVVMNLSVGDTEKPWTPPDGITIVELEKAQDDCVIGSTWDGKTFKLPVALPPVVIKTSEEKLTELQDALDSVNAKMILMDAEIKTLKSAKP